MKVKQIFKPVQRHAWLLSCFVSLLISGASPDLHAAILPLDFIHGGSTEASVIDKVDAWAGAKEGSGWITQWRNGKNSNVDSSASVVSDNPLTAGKNRLKVVVNKSASASKRASGNFHRKYDIHEVDPEHTISFQFRLDGGLSMLSQVDFLDSTDSKLSETGGGVSWYIHATPDGGWTVYNGKEAVKSDLQLSENSVYNFTIAVFENQYTVTIYDVTTSQSFTSERLDFFDSDASVGGHLSFILTPIQPSQGIATVEASFGSIYVIPEPGQVALLTLGVASLLFRYRL